MNRPIVFVLGCTDTGKTDVAIRICRSLDGEVVNADALQLYHGLEIATNKVTREEAMGVPHHLLSFLPPTVTDFSIHNFRQKALEAIESIHQRKKLPVVVGGTAYYVESLLYKNNLIDTSQAAENKPSDVEEEVEGSWLEGASNEELHRLLRQVDSASAASLHPNNRHRVLRAIQIFYRTRRAKSQVLLERKAVDLGEKLRFNNSLLLVLDAPKEILDERLDKRVDKMRVGGLRDEVEQFWIEHSSVLSSRFGVMACIGFKEFLPYLMLGENEWRTVKGDKLFEEGIQLVQLHTRQYSRRQRNWISSRFMRAAYRELPAGRVLDATDGSVIAVGSESVAKWLRGEDKPELPSDPKGRKESLEKANQLFHCEECSRPITGLDNYNKHLMGRAHRHSLRSRQRKEGKESSLEGEQR